MFTYIRTNSASGLSEPIGSTISLSSELLRDSLLSNSSSLKASGSASRREFNNYKSDR
jgi:hypothetical protein